MKTNPRNEKYRHFLPHRSLELVLGVSDDNCAMSNPPTVTVS